MASWIDCGRGAHPTSSRADRQPGWPREIAIASPGMWIPDGGESRLDREIPGLAPAPISLAMKAGSRANFEHQLQVRQTDCLDCQRSAIAMTDNPVADPMSAREREP